MLRNYLAVALRTLVRNRLYATISILALAVGFCAATLAGVTLRGDLTYEHFIPGAEDTYIAAAVAAPTGHPALYDLYSPSFVAGLLKLNFPEVSAVTRIASASVHLRHEQTAAREAIYWADPNVFDLLPLPLRAGDLQVALRRPDGIVLTRGVAEKYFGTDDPIGQSILLDETHPLTVMAVIDDLPVNETTLETGIFASGLAAYSDLSQCDRRAPEDASNGAIQLCGRTYLRLARGTAANSVQRAIDSFLPQVYPKFPGMTMSVQLIRIDRVHLFEGLNPGIVGRLTTIGSIALAVLFTACVVFVNLSTARSVRRATEVGVRKVCGASRAELVYQFLSESLIYVAFAAGLGIAMADLALPYVNDFLNSAGRLDFVHDTALIAAAAAIVLVVGVLAGAHPAFVLSSYRPSAVLKGSAQGAGGNFARKSLVVLQFAVLIGLLIASIVIYRQLNYATHGALRIDTDRMLILRAPCKQALLNELRALAGVRGSACSSEALLSRASFLNTRLRDGRPLAVDTTPLDFGIFALYGIQPIVGKMPADNMNDLDLGPSENASQIVINETAARSFGFPTAAAAIGQPLPLVVDSGSSTGLTQGRREAEPSKQIVAVVPDFAMDVGLYSIRPTIYLSSTPDAKAGNQLISVKLTEHDIPETLRAIDRVTLETMAGTESSRERFFLDQYIRNLYAMVLKEAQALGVLAAVATLLACFGLLGLSSAVTESRTREIGIRKAMGASSSDILLVLLWQFSKPILWANLVAWPVSAVLLHRWLERFADHVDLNPLTFLAAGALALLLALATVSAHAFLVARAKPVNALRYE